VIRLFVTETGEQEKDSRYIQGSWVPYALPAMCLDISSAEAQLGQVHATELVACVLGS
jgi:hypothetical protein